MESRKRLRPWLWQHTDAGDFGLKWVSKEEGIFRMPWMHRSSRSWNKDHCQVFKEWAKFTNRYREGDEEDYPGWKTRLRTALTKLHKDFEEVPELHKKDDLVNPYKVYRFKKTDNHREKVDSSISHSPASSDCLDTSPSSSSSFSHSPHSNIPQKAILAGNIPNILEYDSKINDSDLDTSNDSKFYNIHPYEDSLYLQQSFPDVVVNDTEMRSQPNSRGLPSDLQNLDVDNLALSEHLPSNEMNDYKSDSLPTLDVASYNQSSCPNTDKPTVSFQLFYLDKVVKEGFLYSNAYHFHFGKLPDVNVSPIVFGPPHAEKVELPDVTNMKRSINSQQQKLIQDILLQLNRGFLIQCDGKGDIYAQRLCRTRIFATSPTLNNQVLDRQSKEAKRVFDLQHFKENHLDENKRSPHTIFTFAQEYKLSSFKTPLMHIKLTSLEAKRLWSHSSTGNSGNLQFSDLNSGDLELEHQMKSLTLGGNIDKKDIGSFVQ